MNSYASNRHFRTFKETTPILKEYLRVGHSATLTSSKSINTVLEACRNIEPKTQKEFSGLISLYSKLESTTAPTTMQLARTAKNRAKTIVTSAARLKRLNTDMKRVGSRRSIRFSTVQSKTGGAVILNSPMDGVNTNQILNYFHSEHRQSRPPRLSREEPPPRVTMFDQEKFLVEDEPHADCECKSLAVPFHESLKVSPTIWKNLYIGCIRAASSHSELKKHRIYAVLSIGRNKPNQSTRIVGGYRYINWELSGRTWHFLTEAEAFISSHIQQGNVLVTCYSGSTRSCCAVLAFLVIQFKCSVEAGLRLLQSVRPGLRIPSDTMETLRKLQLRQPTL